MYSTLSTVYTCTRTRTYCIILDLLYVEDSVFVLYIYHLTKQSQLERIVYFLSYILIIPYHQQTDTMFVYQWGEHVFILFADLFFLEEKISLLYFLILFAVLFFERKKFHFCTFSFYLQICFLREKKNLISVLSHSICRSVFEREQNLISVLSHSICRSVFWERKKSHFCTFSHTICMTFF